MPDLWFVAGLALGMVLMGFCTIGSLKSNIFAHGAAGSARVSAMLHGLARPTRAQYTGLSFEPQRLAEVA